jgi:hypothetical protein
MVCQHCATLENVIDELSDQLSRGRRTRRELSATIRLLREEVNRQIEKEHELEIQPSALCQADGFAEEDSNVS